MTDFDPRWMFTAHQVLESDGECRHDWLFERLPVDQPVAISRRRDLRQGGWLTRSAVPPDLRKHMFRGVLLSLPAIEAVSARLTGALARSRPGADYGVRFRILADLSPESKPVWAQLELSHFDVGQRGVPEIAPNWDMLGRLRTWRYEAGLWPENRLQIDPMLPVPVVDRPGWEKALSDLGWNHDAEVEDLLDEIAKRFII